MRASRRAKHTPIVLSTDLQMLFSAVQPRLLASFLAMASVADTAAEWERPKHVQTLENVLLAAERLSSSTFLCNVASVASSSMETAEEVTRMAVCSK